MGFTNGKRTVTVTRWPGLQNNQTRKILRRRTFQRRGADYCHPTVLTQRQRGHSLFAQPELRVL